MKLGWAFCDGQAGPAALLAVMHSFSAKIPLGELSQVDALARTQNQLCAGGARLTDRAKMGCMNEQAAQAQLHAASLRSLRRGSFKEVGTH